MTSKSITINEAGLKSFLFVVDSSTLSLADALERINADDAIENWQQIMPDVAVLVSRLSLGNVHNRLKQFFPTQRYLIVRADGTSKNGWLPKSSWTFMNKPKSVFEADE